MHFLVKTGMTMAALLPTSATHNENSEGKSPNHKVQEMKIENSEKKALSYDTATFGAGCFWCVEAVFQDIKGVKEVKSGYSGGFAKNPSYQEVCTGTTGHAEVCQILFDPSEVSFKDLLEAFWLTHDPTTLNRQGNDVGDQYRSVIFFHNDQQRMLAEEYKKELNASGAFSRPILTIIEPFAHFYQAENYHQNYYSNNKFEPYCQHIIQPKLEKFHAVFQKK